MIITRGIIRPNGHKTHHHGAISFYEECPREFHVDDAAQAVKDVPALGADKKGETLADYAARLKPLVLTPAAYAELRAKFGGALVCEPSNGFNGEAAARVVSEAQAEIASLKAHIADLEQQNRALKEHAARHVAEHDKDMAAITELQQQLAAAKSLAADKPGKPAK